MNHTIYTTCMETYITSATALHLPKSQCDVHI